MVHLLLKLQARLNGLIY